MTDNLFGHILESETTVHFYSIKNKHVTPWESSLRKKLAHD